MVGTCTKKVVKAGDKCLYIYYWDEDGEEDMTGWWFGSEVGGEEVWMQNQSKSRAKTPPEDGWISFAECKEDTVLLLLDVAMFDGKVRRRRPKPTSQRTIGEPEVVPSRDGIGESRSRSPMARGRIPQNPPGRQLGRRTERY